MPSKAPLSRLALVAIACCVALHGRPGVAEEVLRNQDVLKMVTAGLGDELIVGKIQEAPQVEFQLAVDDLVALRRAGVSERVVNAMLARNKQQTRPQRVPPPAPAASSVSLRSGDSTMALHEAVGEVSSAGMGVFQNVFLNYAGLQSTARTSDRRPVLLVNCSSGPNVGHYFLAKLDSDRRHLVRSLKIGKGIRRVGHAGGALAPDEDWVIPYDVKEEGPGTWTVTPQRRLEPGEYGLYVNLETTPMGSAAVEGINSSTPQQRCFIGGGIFDFGVD
jgi:hypothetical protein